MERERLERERIRIEQERRKEAERIAREREELRRQQQHKVGSWREILECLPSSTSFFSFSSSSFHKSRN